MFWNGWSLAASALYLWKTLENVFAGLGFRCQVFQYPVEFCKVFGERLLLCYQADVIGVGEFGGFNVGEPVCL